MSTPSQVLANQANAQLSTGPRTVEGKAASARNARTHGLTAREVVIHPGEQPDFDQLLEDLTEELAPEGTLETLTFNNLVHAAWNQRRCRLLEAELADRGLDPLVDPAAEAESSRIGRYAARAERSYYRALRELRTLQTNRALRNELLDDEYNDEGYDHPEERDEFESGDDNDEFEQNEPNDGEQRAAVIPPLAEINHLTKQTQSAPKPHYRDPFFEALSAPPFPEFTARRREEYLAGLVAQRQQANQ
jgi:hypothetical protein